ncbi:M43 family zinc metalloprotease [Runella limosa]|uniref:M43 family zinc metalloprotease n=1 Tax=Runella limosa TaxID=370978 RepID=UPI0004916BA5|nr:M43 family zinc metalloprotease [Runella limosa]
MRQLLYIFALSILTNFAAHAQRRPEPCATMEMDSLRRLRFPSEGSLDDFERDLQRKMVELKSKMASSRGAADIITIPVVVHVIHNGEAVGVGRNISQAQIQSQIETLNEDFRRRVNTNGFNNDARGADIEIEFCMAQFNPNGQRMTEAGIDRVNGNRTNWARTDIEGSLKPTTSWDPNKYYNIWVLDFAAQDDNLLGYAQFPSSSGLSGIPSGGGAASTDGVVINYANFGNSQKGSFSLLRAPYNLGRTLTHETGHWLGLRHIWGDAACGDDFCADTPTQASESRGCQKGRISCGGANMVENYMDYSDDGCFNIFTRDQKTRMRTVMEVSPRRASLLTSNVCGQLISGSPIPNFVAENRTVLLGGQVRFTDLSTNFPTAWKWEFEGGDPATSTTQNPTVTYTTAGKFKVTLTVSNTAGTSAPLVRTEYVEVINAGLCATVTNFSGTGTVLRQTGGTGYIAGQNSRRTQAVAELYSNPLGYTNLRGATLKFGVAKAANSTGTESVVRVKVWNARGFQGGPGSELTVKEIPLRKILDDVRNNRETKVVFDQNINLLSQNNLAFLIGVEFDYVAGDTVALVTTRDGESLNATSWERNSSGSWDRYIVRTGLNIAHSITADVGMKPSVQIQASAQFINPGEAVILQARGAGVINWSPSEGLSSTLGPQVTARPTRTLTYLVKGSGTDVCRDSASATIYVRNVQILGSETLPDKELTLSPNPTDGMVEVKFTNSLRGKVLLRLRSITGAEVWRAEFEKNTDAFVQPINVRTYPAGDYFIDLQLGDYADRKRLVKF